MSQPLSAHDASRPEIGDLQSFYASRQGQLVRRLIAQRLRLAWPDLGGQRVLGLGYALPYLHAMGDGAERAVGLMTAGSWKRCASRTVTGGRCALADEQCLPLADGAVDRVVLVHALEGCDQIRPLLREVWRVLADGGRMLVVVPNRRGLWTLSDQTPFGVGRPYSSSQLQRALRDALFEPLDVAGAVFMPPVRSRLLLRTGMAWERFGVRWTPRFGGVLIAEAEKSIYSGALAAEAETSRLPRYLRVPRRLAAARDHAPEPKLRPAARSATIHQFRPRTRSS
ncbi:class I SAM-dependent methyltransferase [Marinivivus vitaminiproducens]|uniref:class I SAM-dependent methyltransferase n=1 Tax=Marinivivus vitaminiproducens TaxID=3035935 RepID=UPI0027998558|nr:class I SAM-dependent methyltransferase [Geminicoccaceae bacterium SCSIO 64248]